jgi:sulfur carrier protein ThiS
MIRIFPSKLEGEPLERYRLKSKTTIHQWFTDNVKSYEWRESPPISVHVNGDLVTPVDWPSQEIKKKDRVDIYPEPKGVESIIIATIAAVAALAAVVTLLQPSIPKQN